jgi:hypothetical protein
MEPATFQHERGTRLVGGDESIAQAERLTQRKGGRFLREDRIRTCLDREAVDVLGANDSAQTARRLEQLKGHPAFHQLVRCCQTGNAAADDRYHTWILSLTDNRHPGAMVRDPTPSDAAKSNLEYGRGSLRENPNGTGSWRLETGNSKLQGELMHLLRELLHQFERRVGQDAVAKIKDVSGAAAGAAQDVVGGGEQPLPRT